MHFITFITEGSPFDNGFNLQETGRLIQERLSPHFKTVTVFTKRSLKEIPGSDNFCNDFDMPLENNPNAHKIGYFDFKAFLLNHVMNSLPEGEMILYHDGNFSKNPHYFDSDWSNIKEICENLLSVNQSDVWVQIERSNTWVKEHVKRLVIDSIIENEIERELALNSRLINAARILVKNSKFSQAFVNDYAYLCQHKQLLTTHPDPNRHPQAKWYCGDQDVLNALVYRYIFDGRFQPDFPKYAFGDRVIRIEQIVGKDGITRGGIIPLVDENIVKYMSSGKKDINIENRISVY